MNNHQKKPSASGLSGPLGYSRVMLMLPAMQAVLQAADRPTPSDVQLRFAEPTFNTRLRLESGNITAIRSPLLPTWSSTLLREGVNANAMTQAQLRSRQADEVLATLVEGGHLEAKRLVELTRERVLSALLPLVWRTSLVEIGGVTVQSASALTSTNVAESVSAAELHAGALGKAEQNLRTADRFVASPLATAQSLATEQAKMVYHAALHGLSLGEMAKRHALRWDTLTRTVLELVHAGALRPETQAKAAARLVAGRLDAGHMAPDFCLPDFGGGDVRLSDLRGEKVWLIFNRQSTCALCNPHHTQIIAMNERMREKGVRIVSVWGSTVADLALGIGKLRPPYPVLADPQDETYDAYGLSHSLRGFFDLRNMPTAIEGLKMMGLSALKDDGELTRMPAEFLIGADGRIEVSHYNSYGVDWLPMERVLDWAERA